MNPTFTRAHETTELLELFVKLSVNQDMSFSAASKKLGFLVDSKSSAYQSAKRIAAKEHRIYIVHLRSYGFRRGDGPAMSKGMDGHLMRSRRNAKRGIVLGELAMLTNLIPEEQRAAQEKLTRLQLVHSISEKVKVTTNRPKAEEPPIVESSIRRPIVVA